MTFRTREIERATHDIGVHLQTVLRDLNVTQAEIHVLGYLAGLPSATVGDIHVSFGHRRSTLSSVLNGLERRNLIVRSINPDDRRSIVVTLTPAGVSSAERVQLAVADLESRVVGATETAERQGFRAVLAAVEAATRYRVVEDRVTEIIADNEA